MCARAVTVDRVCKQTVWGLHQHHPPVGHPAKTLQVAWDVSRESCKLAQPFSTAGEASCTEGLPCCPHLPQVLLSVQRQQRPMPSADASRSGEADATPHRTTLKVSSCQAYESLLMAALRSQVSQRVYRQGEGGGGSGVKGWALPWVCYN